MAVYNMLVPVYVSLVSLYTFSHSSQLSKSLAKEEEEEVYKYISTRVYIFRSFGVYSLRIVEKPANDRHDENEKRIR